MLVKGVRMEGVPSHGREGGEKAPAEHMEGEGPRWGSGGELSGPGAEPEVFCTPRPGVHDHYQRTQRELTSRNQLGGCGRVQPPLRATFFFFFFLWVREAALPPMPRKARGGRWSPGPHQLANLWKGAPSPSTACSLELSLPSPAGI